jgi:N-acetylglucosamine-6-phosphate deacetylase
LGHSDATAQEAKAGCCAGARSATHTFNAMRNLSNRELGVVECVLDEDALSAEIICDGIHVDPALVRLFFKAKGPDRSILVTDGAAPMGLPEGRHTIGNRKLEVKNGLCTSDGVLAGSICAMDRAVMNFSNFTESDLPTSLRLATMNPAKLMNLDNEWGLLEKGREANILALSSTGEIQQVFRAGRPLL